MGFKAVLSAATERSLWETACMALKRVAGDRATRTAIPIAATWGLLA